jgi:hypothetical protein
MRRSSEVNVCRLRGAVWAELLTYALPYLGALGNGIKSASDGRGDTASLASDTGRETVASRCKPADQARNVADVQTG